MTKNNTFLFGSSGFIGTHLNNSLKKKADIKLVVLKKKTIEKRKKYRDLLQKILGKNS